MTKPFFETQRTGRKNVSSATAVFISQLVTQNTGRTGQRSSQIILRGIRGESTSGTAAAVILSVAGSQILDTIHIPANGSVYIPYPEEPRFAGTVNVFASGSSSAINADFSYT